MLLPFFMGRDKNFPNKEGVFPIYSSFQDFHEDDFSITRGIEVGEESLLNVSAGKIEGPSRFILGAGGGVRIKPARPRGGVHPQSRIPST